jgi:hypothetical protein
VCNFELYNAQKGYLPTVDAAYLMAAKVSSSSINAKRKKFSLKNICKVVFIVQ